MTTVHDFEVPESDPRVHDFEIPENQKSRHEWALSPINTYDEHENALFLQRLAQFDTEDGPIIPENAKKRSALMLNKTIYEMRICESQAGRTDVGRHDQLAFYVGQVTEVSDRIELFRQAFYTRNAEVLFWLGDMRRQAEETEDIDLIARYLMEEVRFGLNISDNIDDLYYLRVAQDGNAKGDRQLESALSESVILSLDRGEIENAKLVQACRGSWSTKREKEFDVPGFLLKTVEEKRKITIAKGVYMPLRLKNNGDIGLGSKRRRYEREGLSMDTASTEVIRLTGATYHYPKTKELGLIQALLDPGHKQQASAVNALISYGIGATPTSLTALELYAQKICPELVMVAHKQVAEERKAGYNQKVESFAIEALDEARALALAVAHEHIEDDEEVGFVHFAAQMEVLTEEYLLRTPSTVINNQVDLVRFRTQFNNQLESMYEVAQGIPSRSKRYRALVLIAKAQMLHDPSARLSSKILQELNEVGEACKGSSIDRLVVQPEEIEQDLRQIEELRLLDPLYVDRTN